MNQSTFADLCEKRYSQLKPNIADYVDFWASKQPTEIALIETMTKEKVNWKDFSVKSQAFAAKLLSLGIQRGDVIATTLPLIKEHVYLMYACFRIGVIVAPLDLRLKQEEIEKYFLKMKPKAYFFLGKTEVADFRPQVQYLFQKFGRQVSHWVQFQKEREFLVPGVQGITDFARDIKRQFIFAKIFGKIRRAQRAVNKCDPALIIFTTGSTGEPKAALLSHDNILAQVVSLGTAVGLSKEDCMLANLPPSHVACITEQLIGAIYGGSRTVLIPIFKAEDSLKAVQEYKVTLIGQLPALFQMQWLLPNYSDYDLSSLRAVVYGGQEGNPEFLEKLSKMSPKMMTGLGLTETAGFCSYTDLTSSPEVLKESIGFESPLAKLSIREPMQSDGRAGLEKASGEIGEICVQGPQVFLGYLGDEESTKKTISKEGVLYTGDMGSYNPAVGLQLSGRRKLVLKPKGFQVFPGEIEAFIVSKMKPRVLNVACVGVPHNVYSESIMAFVEVRVGEQVDEAEVIDVSKGLAAYARPSLVKVLYEGEMPLTRSAKTDYMTLRTQALSHVEELRASGNWDT